MHASIGRSDDDMIRDKFVFSRLRRSGSERKTVERGYLYTGESCFYGKGIRSLQGTVKAMGIQQGNNTYIHTYIHTCIVYLVKQVGELARH